MEKIIRKSYKFRIYPSKAQVTILETTLDLCRELYNAGLQERRDAWQLNKVSISYFDQQNQLPEIKTIRDDLKSVHSQVLCDVLNRLDKSFRRFFERVQKGEKSGFPRFKSQSRYDSFCYPQVSNCAVNFLGNKIKLPKIGKIKIKLSRTIIGKVKSCTVKREIDKWFVVFLVETCVESLPKTGKQVGIDMGIENFATLSDGTQIENNKFYQTAQKKLRVAQRRVERRKKSSTSRKKAVLQLKKIHQKIRNQRNDFAHKISTQLVREYDLIAIEKLQIRNMVKNHHLAKSISDVAWYNFFQILRYKAECADKKLIEVNSNGTSQTCICGEKVKKKLSVRWHQCQVCGLSEHRDIVSAKVILQRAGHTLLAQTKTIRL